MTHVTKAISPLRQRMIEDMMMRKLSPQTQTAYLRVVKNFAGFLGQSPDTASAEDLRRYQLHLVEQGIASGHVRSDLLEDQLFRQLGLLLWKRESLEQAVNGSLRTAKNEKAVVESALKGVERQLRAATNEQNTLADKIESGLMPEGGAMFKRFQKKIAENDANLERLTTEKLALKERLKTLDVTLPDDLIDRIQTTMHALTYRAGQNVMKWPDDHKRRLLNIVMAGGHKKKDSGISVYVSQHVDPKNGTYQTYELRGMLGVATGAVSVADSDWAFSQQRITRTDANLAAAEFQELYRELADSAPKRTVRGRKGVRDETQMSAPSN